MCSLLLQWAALLTSESSPRQGADRSSCDDRKMSFQVRHVNHLHLLVADLRRSVAFYRSVFEFEERYTSAAGVVFLHSPAGGSLALEQAGADRLPGLGHFGFSLSGGSEVGSVVDRVVASGGRIIEQGELVTGDPHAVVTDPDGHVIRL
jgi:catechol 2,3-dioxygenase-like lactoylglutathione lyase family enzyme